MATKSPTKRIGNRYLLHTTIGQGGMGIVYRATDRLTGREVALKSVIADLEALNIDDSLQASDFRLALAREFKLSRRNKSQSLCKLFCLRSLWNHDRVVTPLTTAI